MSRKFDHIAYIPSYGAVLTEMKNDLVYRLKCRTNKTSLGRPLYERINVQMVITRMCPHKCDFCIERQNPIGDNNDNFKEQLESLKRVLAEHKNATLSITGGEPSLFVSHVKNIVNVYKEHSNNVFVTVNTTGYNPAITDIPDININLSCNKFVDNSKFDEFKNCVYQTVLEDKDMNIPTFINIMKNSPQKEFSFRYKTMLDKSSYDISVLDTLQHNPKFKVKTFRIGDFFLYATFNYKGKKARITLGDMRQQQLNDYQDGYSNIIIHPDGKIGLNWK